MKPRQTLADFDVFLAGRGLRLEAVVLGGAALELLGLISRPTRDCDVLHPELSPVILEAAREFARAQRAKGEALDDDWLNNGPAQLVGVLPPGWEQRTQPAFSGEALELRALGRLDLLRTKLFALCDRGTDLGDCVALAPSPAEMAEVRAWVERQDGNPEWPRHVSDVLVDLAGGLVMFRRDASARALLEGDALTRAMAGIGMLFASEAQPDPNLEDTVLAASEEGLLGDDLRVLGVLVDWLDVFFPWLNADRLTRLVRASGEVRLRAFWASFAQRHRADRRFARLLQSPEPRVDLLRVGAEFQVRRRGEDERFVGTVLRVPAGVLRQRAADVLAPEDLAQRHRAFRWRVVLGPSYRADMWAMLEVEPGLSAAELARRTYGSFATAWAVKRDKTIVQSGRDRRQLLP